MYSQAEAFVTKLNTASDKPASAGNIFQTTSERKWVEMSTQVIRVETAIRSVGIAVGLATVALLVFTHNFIAAGFATLTIACVCSCILVRLLGPAPHKRDCAHTMASTVAQFKMTMSCGGSTGGHGGVR